MAWDGFGLPKFKLSFASLADCWYNNIIIKRHMVNRGKKNNLEKIFFNQIFLTLIGLIVIILIGWPLAKNAVKQHNINQEIGDFKKEIVNLQNKSVDLKNFVSFLESDQFVEEYARLNLNLKKPGEEKTVIKIDATDLASPPESDPIFNIPGREKVEPSPEISNPKKWLNYFLK